MAFLGSHEKITGVALLAGLIFGMVVGGFTGYQAAQENSKAEQQKTAAIELRVKDLDIERVELEKLIQAIEQFQTEVDEIILYMAKGKVTRIRFADWPPEEK